MLKTNSKQSKILILFFAFMLICLTLMPIRVNAIKKYCAVCDTDHDFKLNIFTAFLFEERSTVLGGQLFSKSSSGDIDITDVLMFDTETTFKPLWEYAEGAYNTMFPVGQVLIIIYFLLDLMEKQLQDKLTAELMLRSFAKFLGMLILLNNGFELLTLGMQLATSVYLKLEGYASFSDASFTCQKDAIDDMKWYKALGDIFVQIIPYFLLKVAQFCVRIIAWSRCLNIVLRVIFAPVGMADMVKGGSSSQGVSYFKKIVASSFQGAVIMGVSTVYSLIASAMTTAFADSSGFSWLGTLLLAAVTITLMFRTNSMAEEVLGA